MNALSNKLANSFQGSEKILCIFWDVLQFLSSNTLWFCSVQYPVSARGASEYILEILLNQLAIRSEGSSGTFSAQICSGLHTNTFSFWCLCELGLIESLSGEYTFSQNPPKSSCLLVSCLVAGSEKTFISHRLKDISGFSKQYNSSEPNTVDQLYSSAVFISQPLLVNMDYLNSPTFLSPRRQLPW